MPTARTEQSRSDRYSAVIQSAQTVQSFSLQSIQLCLREEQPAFVTRAVNALVRDGCLTKIESSAETTFRWCAPRDFSAETWLQNQSGSRITNTPMIERPRERLLANGAASLRTAELLAILIRTGKSGESALQAGEKIANHFADCLDELSHAGRGELKAISRVIGDAAYCQIMAGTERDLL